MLPKIRNLIVRPRSGVVALAVLAALSVSVSASAAVPGFTPGGPLAQTYFNLAKASSQTDNRTNFTVRFQLDQTSAATLNVTNRAVASTSGCVDCGAFAIGFQVVFASTRSPVALNAVNTADATSTCPKCSTLAGAYQIIDVSDSQQRLSWAQIRGLAQIRGQLLALQYSGLDPDQVQTKAGQLANQAVAILQDGPDPTPVFSPAVNGLARPAQLTENNGPYIDLFIKVQHPGD